MVEKSCHSNMALKNKTKEGPGNFDTDVKETTEFLSLFFKKEIFVCPTSSRVTWLLDPSIPPTKQTRPCCSSWANRIPSLRVLLGFSRQEVCTWAQLMCTSHVDVVRYKWTPRYVYYKCAVKFCGHYASFYYAQFDCLIYILLLAAIACCFCWHAISYVP